MTCGESLNLVTGRLKGPNLKTNMCTQVMTSIGALFALATPDFRPTSENIFSSDRLAFPLDDLLCGVCKHIVNQAVETPCCQQFFLHTLHLDVVGKLNSMRNLLLQAHGIKSCVSSSTS